ncbi:hypothetical protein GF382_01525 [Candidatus Falkowbacteria bacterium]|nr:hypothetical protein [Candidatus Falkowbacteria bacterium]
MGLFNLPKAGHKFSIKSGLGNFSEKLKSITRYGELKNLKNNIPAITKAFKSYEKYIKRGGLSFRQRYCLWRKIKKMDKNLNKEDEREIKKIIDQYKR